MGTRFGDTINEFRSVVILVVSGSRPIDIAGPIGVFDRATALTPTDASLSYAPLVATVASRPTPNGAGPAIPWVTTRELKHQIDTILIAASDTTFETTEFKEALDWLRQTAGRIRRIAAMSTGVLLLAEAGLLNGRQATTDWRWCEELAQRYPKVQVRPDRTLVRDGNLWTSSGFAAGIHQALALVEEDYGYDLALRLALELEIPLRAPAVKTLLLGAPLHQTASTDPLRELQRWIGRHLRETLHVERLAGIAGMSRRTFAREFVRTLGMTPAKYIEEVRVDAARRLLGQTSSDLDEIARRCGFGCADSMRRVFVRTLHVTPTVYRLHFQQGDRVGQNAGSGQFSI
jgi:transcriptional regulator GlxA family with amidase domain